MGVKLPAWAEELRNRYLAGEASMFLLHGNVRDLQCWEGEDGKREWLDLRSFLERFLERTRDVTVYYNVSQGLQFPEQAAGAGCSGASSTASRQLRGDDKLAVEPPRHRIADAIPVIEDLVTDPAHSSGVIVDYFEMIAPQRRRRLHGRTMTRRISWRCSVGRPIRRSCRRTTWSSWCASTSPTYRAGLPASAQLATIQVRVSRSSRIAGRDFLGRPGPVSEVDLKMEVGRVGEDDRGACRWSRFATSCAPRRSPKDPVTFSRRCLHRKKEIIEQECHGLVEFIPPRHDFSARGRHGANQARSCARLRTP